MPTLADLEMLKTVRSSQNLAGRPKTSTGKEWQTENDSMKAGLTTRLKNQGRPILWRGEEPSGSNVGNHLHLNQMVASSEDTAGQWFSMDLNAER